jgi:hypothetical protein
MSCHYSLLTVTDNVPIVNRECIPLNNRIHFVEFMMKTAFLKNVFIMTAREFLLVSMNYLPCWDKIKTRTTSDNTSYKAGALKFSNRLQQFIACICSFIIIIIIIIIVIYVHISVIMKTIHTASVSPFIEF